MEHRAEPGLQPYEPPSGDVARAYLDESARVARRREAMIDRRGAARLLLVEGAAFSTYLIALMFCFPPTDRVNVIALGAPFILWTQLASALREEYGYQRRGREQRLRTAVVALLVVMAVGSLTVLTLGIDIPTAVRLAPAALALVLFGILAVDEGRRAPSERGPRQRIPFDRAIRIETMCIGLAMGIMIACVATPSAIVAHIANLVVMLALVAWLFSATSAGGSRTAAAWGAFHWSCLAIGGAILVALALTAQFTTLPLAAAACAAGAVVTAAFALGAALEQPHA